MRDDLRGGRNGGQAEAHQVRLVWRARDGDEGGAGAGVDLLGGFCLTPQRGLLGKRMDGARLRRRVAQQTASTHYGFCSLALANPTLGERLSAPQRRRGMSPLCPKYIAGMRRPSPQSSASWVPGATGKRMGRARSSFPVARGHRRTDRGGTLWLGIHQDAVSAGKGQRTAASGGASRPQVDTVEMRHTARY